MASGSDQQLVTSTWVRPRVRLALGKREPIDILRTLPSFSWAPTFYIGEVGPTGQDLWIHSFQLNLFSKLVALGMLLLGAEHG